MNTAPLTATVFRPSLLAASFAAAFALVGQAHAYDQSSFFPIPSQKTPDWLLLVGHVTNPCTGTVITPHLVVTASHCAHDGKELSSPKDGYRYTGQVKKVLLTTGFLVGDKPIRPLKSTAPVFSYADERKHLREGLPFYVLGYNANPQSAAVDPYSGNGLFRAIMGYPSSSFVSAGIPGVGFSYQPGPFPARTLWTNPPSGYELPFTTGDDGAPILAGEFDDESGVMGLVAGKHMSATGQVRLSSLWPDVYRMLMERGLRDDAIALSQKVLGTGEWGANDRRGTVGQIFVYNNPYNQKVEFFRLAALGSDQRYWYFPTNQKDNDYWQYLGNDLPSFAEATTPIHQWGENGRQGVVGDIYIYANPYTQQVEFFRLKKSGLYWYFPTNKTDNADWVYLGTRLPVAP